MKKMRLVNDPSTQYDRTNIVRKLVPKVPKVPKQKEELMDAEKWYDNWVPMTLEQYEASYQKMQRRQDRRPPGKVSGRKKPRPRVGPPPPKPAARPVLSSFMSAPGPRRPPGPPPGHQEDKTEDNTKDKPHQEENKDKPQPAQDGLFVPLSYTEEEPSQEVDLGFFPETSQGNIGDLPVVEDISNDIESFFSSETEPETKPKREYNSNSQISYRPFPSDSDHSQPAGYFTTDYVSPTTATTAPPLKEDILLDDPREEISLQPQAQLGSVTPRPLPDLIFQEQPEISEEVHNRRQAFLGHQIPILSQTTEMNQDEAHSFVFE